MKKTLLAALGLAGACVACCSIPIALTLVSGLSAAGLVAWLADSLTAQTALAIATALLAAGLGFGMWRAKGKTACVDTPAGASCSTGGPAGCTCAPGAGKATGT